jgi:DNA-binding CsgD family transcriptional regulator
MKHFINERDGGMADGGHGSTLHINMDERRLSVVVFSLFFSWLLAFPFEGQILYSLVGTFDLLPDGMIFGAIAVHFAGLLLCGFFIKTMKAAKRLMLSSIAFCILASGVFFFPPSFLWTPAIVSSSFLAGSCVAAWGFYFKSGTPKNERIKTAADGLIYSNILMILLNMAAIHLSPYMGLGLSMLVLGAAFLFALRLPTNDGATPSPHEQAENSVSIVKPLAFLCLFVVIIAINSGLMYQVLNPAYAHLEWLTSWYWAIPYIVALYIMRNLPRKINRTYILYVAIAMIGFSFIAFMSLNRSAPSYLVVNTLMLGACGVYDLFWWSILGEMLDFDENPAKVLGVGLSANVLGVLLGGLIGNAITSAGTQSPNSSVLALAVVCVTLVILPPLHKHLSALLKDHAYLTVLSEMSLENQGKALDSFTNFGQLTERESEIAALLLKGKTYRMIAGELHVSENTVKTHIKNIYSKLKIQSRTELINIMLEQQSSVRQ